MGFGKTGTTASNDLNEETLDALNKQASSLFVIREGMESFIPMTDSIPFRVMRWMRLESGRKAKFKNGDEAPRSIANRMSNRNENDFILVPYNPGFDISVYCEYNILIIPCLT